MWDYSFWNIFQSILSQDMSSSISQAVEEKNEDILYLKTQFLYDDCFCVKMKMDWKLLYMLRSFSLLEDLGHGGHRSRVLSTVCLYGDWLQGDWPCNWLPFLSDVVSMIFGFFLSINWFGFQNLKPVLYACCNTGVYPVVFVRKDTTDFFNFISWLFNSRAGVASLYRISFEAAQYIQCPSYTSSVRR